MNELLLARLQFGITTVYHFFFVPLTIGLSFFIAFLETMYVKSGDTHYRDLTKFWGKIFLINFAMGVVTGIVQEFQFGMNWSEYSRFVGDIFGAPLAIEALLAFFLESVALAVWIFGWDKLPKAAHAGLMWAVAIGTQISAFWILVANSFMQQPMGYIIRNGRAEMADFVALVTNPHVWFQFSHVVTGAFCTGAFFVLGVSAWHMMRAHSPHREMFRRCFAFAAVYATASSLAVAGLGHFQAQHMANVQPMKMAAAEALWDTADPAPFSIFSIVDESHRRDYFSIKIPYILTILEHNDIRGEVKGINQLQAEYEKTYGPGNYIPPINVTFWTFRAMVGAGGAMILLGLVSVFLIWKRRELDAKSALFMKLLVPAIALPYIANSTGWIFTEMGRQPWLVYGLQKTANGLSPSVTYGQVALSLIGFTIVYGALMVVDAYLMAKFARQGPTAHDTHATAPQEAVY